VTVFDDPSVGLVREPFVGGAGTMNDCATAHIPSIPEPLRSGQARMDMLEIALAGILAGAGKAE
jgi:hypothetical protein